LSFLLAL